MTAVGNFLGCLMSFCIVGNVEAPPNENRTAPKPRKKFFIVGEECTEMIDHFRIHLFDTSKCGDRSESRRKMKHEISAFTFGCHLFIELILWLIYIAGRGFRNRHGSEFQTPWLHCATQNMFTLHRHRFGCLCELGSPITTVINFGTAIHSRIGIQVCIWQCK